MPEYTGYFIDLDATLYKGTTRIPAGKRFVDRLLAADRNVLYLTNNSTKNPAEVAANLVENHDIPATADQVYTSALATADHLATAYPNAKTVLVVGEHGLQEAVTAKGYTIVTEAPADIVVAGLDRQLSYEKLAQATLAIQGGAAFIATNADTNLPSERGMMPGAGTIIAALKTSTGITPTIVGKPERLIMELALQKTQQSADQVIMVGDNYNTDTLAGINAGIDSLLVYTGVSTPEQVAQMPAQPTYTVDSLDEWEVK